MLEKLKKLKSKIRYSTLYKSSVKKKIKASLGTIEKDASGFFGKFKLEKFRGEKIFKLFCTFPFKSVLDVGAGDAKSSLEFVKNRRQTDIIELSTSYYFKKKMKNFNKIYIGDFVKKKFSKKYDAIYISHVLEHQENIKLFLDKVFSSLKKKGFLCIIVPPRKPFIISGHYNFFNQGLLCYRLVMSKFNCQKIKIITYDYNIGIILKKKEIKKFPKLRGDIGDLDKLKNYFPKKFRENRDFLEGFNGDIQFINLSKKETKIFKTT